MKYGGINDMPLGWTRQHERFYSLWRHMLRRCYDAKNQSTSNGRSYIGCTVCDEWFVLSKFVADVQTLPGYCEWASGRKMVFDKDTIVPGNRQYNKMACCFITESESAFDVHRRHPEITQYLGCFPKHGYAIHKDDTTIRFDSEKAACEFLGVPQCTIGNHYRRKRRCKGYTITQCAQHDT